jgi:hypothetical protein
MEKFQILIKQFVWQVLNTVFPHIVFSLEYFPPLNTFPTLVSKLFKFSLHRRKTNAETIWIFQGFTISKKNSCRGNYMRKYGMLSLSSTFQQASNKLSNWKTS